MPSRLSSLLVRDGLVGVKRMEKAFQRQVIYGGSLDTILLEMGLVPDERLTQYLSLASGLPPASRVETNVFDAEAVRRCPEDSAFKHRVVPLCLEGDALRVLVCDPVDMVLLEELADVADLPIQPLIVPEYRWHVVFARAFGTQAPARFAALAKQIDAAPVTAPVGKARSVIVTEPKEDSGVDHVVVDVVDHGAAQAVALKPSEIAARAAAQAATVLRPVGSEAVTMRFAAVTPPPEEFPPAPVAQAVPIATTDAPTEPLLPPRTRTKELSTPAYAAALEDAEHQRKDAEQRRRPTTGEPQIEIVSEPPLPGPATDVMDVPPVPEEDEPARIVSGPSDAVIRAPLTTGSTPDGDRHPPMSPVVAREALQVAEDRDRVFMILLRTLRSRARWAGLMTVQGGAVIGRLAVAEALVDVSQVGTILIPLDGDSAFRTAVTTQKPYVGELATGDRDIDGMIERMGGQLPPSGLLLPIVLRDRVVALAVAHRIDLALGLADVAELLPFAGAVADALGRLIVKHKAAGYRAPEAPPPSAPVVSVAADEVATKRVDRPKAGSAWRIPTAPVTESIETGTEMVVDAEPARPAAELVAAIEAASEGDAEPLFAEAVHRAQEIVPLIGPRFPGRLRVDRYQVSGRALRAAQYGGLLELVVRLGPPASELVIEKLGDTHRDTRFYATVCAAELRPRSAVYALVERLFDSDFGVRACAIEALVGYPLRELDAALARARHALHSEDPERVLAAATAVAELGDTTAIPDLLDTVGRESRRAEHARRALVGLTKQDFGTSERKWRKWWDEHRTRHRIEWLIEGLVHKEQPLRQSASEDLRRLTGEHFDYHHDLPKRDREVSQQRWQTWWKDVGQRRFARDDDERMRPTATLPALRKD